MRTKIQVLKDKLKQSKIDLIKSICLLFIFIFIECLNIYSIYLAGFKYSSLLIGISEIGASILIGIFIYAGVLDECKEYYAKHRRAKQMLENATKWS